MLGLSSYAYYWSTKETGQENGMAWSASDLLDRTASLDLKVLQICENLPLLDWNRDDLERLADYAMKKCITLEVGARGLNVDCLIANLHIAHALQSRILRFSPWSGFEARQDMTLERLNQVVNHLLPLCKEYDITIAIENYFDLPDQALASFIRQVNDDHVGVCLDTANSVGLLQKPLETAALLAPFVVSLHLKDFVVSKPAMGFVVSGVPLGQGWLDGKAVLDLIHQAGRQPNVLLELWVEHSADHHESMMKEDEWVRQSVSYARHHLGLT